ncbi:hypothetical protein FHG08_08120 [Pseudoalteromonas sp. Scap03]|uniref:hypothetical protein n=1 Tax=unclassified Pseudoalteromonas TaxID=194690 RepID=UPI0015BE8777|nr:MULTISPECIES: hypothetical protein [unclassified Pseudoalteromonas]NWL15685.1 hypothetical protein [Pseudoalteromonas sp. Scap03]QLE80829.1 hypothetical protein FLM54_04390 [Pseudoalteromonas sp. Scap25]QLE88772.1 hypothetical protein FLM47_04385 [Pseudoalteromonas sp. Scap06]
MKIEDIKLKIERSEFYKNYNVKQLIKLVIDLYESYRIENTNLEYDGDMLLFQCREDSLSKDYFIVDITRQIIPDLDDIDEATDAMQQLSTTFKFLPSEAAFALSTTSQWCSALNEVDSLRAFIENSEAFQWAIKNDVVKVDIELSYI